MTVKNINYVQAKLQTSLSRETPTESFDIIDFNLSYKPVEFITIGFGVDNIADVNYYEHTSRPYKNMDEKLMFFEPGRNFKLSLRIDF